VKGWYGQSHRHYLAAKGIKTNYYSKMSKSQKGAPIYMVRGRKADAWESKPFKYQDENQERMIHSEWDGGSYYAGMLMHSGDVFRELAQPSPQKMYIGEKIRLLENHIKRVKELRKKRAEDPDTDEFIVEMKKRYELDPRDTGVHPQDSLEFARETNEDKFSAMYSSWDSQPYENELQETAIELNKAMLTGDYDLAQSKINTIKKGINLKDEEYKAEWEM